MSAYDATGVETTGTTERIDDRTRRAVTEYLTVLPDEGAAAGAPDLYTVVSHSGETYLVDARSGACECADAEYRDPEDGCKHARRVAFATGERAIPAGVGRDDVDEQLGRHVDGEPRHAATDGGTDEIVVAGDGTEVLEGDEEDVVDLSEVSGEADPERPEDCDCAPFLADGGLPCWPCYREGFEAPNPEVTADEDGEEGA